MRRFPLFLVSALLLAACGGAPTAQTTPSPEAAPSVAPTVEASVEASVEPSPSVAAKLSPEEIDQKVAPATVRVVAQYGENALDAEGLGAGTGIVYDTENGYIITNAHVVEGASSVQIAVADSTRTRPATVVGRAQCDDLAVLKVKDTEGLEAVELGDSSELNRGAEVYALGYPLAFDLGNDISFNKGGVSQLKAQLSYYQNLIKHEAPINPGNSGGPLVNDKGEVIGINTLGVDDAQNQNYAIAMSYAKPIIEQLEQGKNVEWIGLNLVPNEFADYFGTDEGVAVIAVQSGSPSSQIGIEPADLLLKIDNTSVNSQEDVCRILTSHQDGDQLKMTILRGNVDEGMLLEGELTVGKQGAADDKTQKLEVVGVFGGEPSQASQAEDPAAVDPAQASSDDPTLLVNNTFDGDDVGTWPVGQEEGYSAEVIDGAYTLNIAIDNMYLFLHPDESADLPNGAIAAQLRPEGTGLAGLMARYSENGDARSMYVCWISNSQQFACSKDVNNSWTVIVQPQTSGAIKPNEYNKVVLAIIGNEFSFQINDEEVAAFTDDSLVSGGWGVYAETTPGNFKAHYDHIAIANAD